MMKPDIMPNEPGWFRNFHRCPACCTPWTDEWSAQCDDDCPHCGARHISSCKSEDIAAQAGGA
jgi:hypothetical protein